MSSVAPEPEAPRVFESASRPSSKARSSEVERLCCENAVELPRSVAVREPVPERADSKNRLDPEAIEAAVAPHVSMLRHVAQRVLRCSEQADDAVQDAIIELWKRGEPPVELRGWLVKTVIHRSLHRRRTEMRRQRWEEEASIAADVTCPLCNPEEEFAQRELLAVTEAAIAGLSSDFEAVIELRARGFEYDEIARKLDLPIGTVRSRLSRARRTLNEQLARATS